ncbi:hypothetical protein BKP45_08280 [Anaerobacillus alkalidiazotrophicus]|uniref:Protein NO VEIN C-terminal domain-containing protein n=1 Tax=Anaerobacillus alkalidiazotrophicus TaxID=472963 RepID=A0A1S2M822_9BACI|nr:DUF3883 domain-containing protein [Anaerobacillus alkalidiazotrophicus]OIJ20784.1 hypothetical protein BKP45_08280 [Anaerobacillus alkalidiazotrophicus]
MSNYSEKEIIAVAIKLLEESGAMTTTELKEALFEEMNPTGNDLGKNKNRTDTKFDQKVRNMVSHRENNELLKYCEYQKVGRNGVLRSKSLSKTQIDEVETQEVQERKRKKRNFRAKIVDFDEINARNKVLGQKGEEYVLQYEKERLPTELSDKVIHVAVEEGDGAGYDILSYDRSGKPKFLEVKTTTGPKYTPFYLSANEKSFLEVYKEDAEIVRVYNFNEQTGQADMYRISGKEFFDKMNVTPIAYKVTVKEE